MTEPVWLCSVPRDPSERLELLGTKPVAWEYLLFGHSLLAGIQRTEGKWRDYVIGYVSTPGPALTDREVAGLLADAFSRASFLAENIAALLTPENQEAAFGPPGTSGDPGLIEHFGDRVIDLYAQVLDWHAELRSWRVSERARQVVDAARAMFGHVPTEVRAFVFDYVARLEDSLSALSVGAEESVEIAMALTLTVDQDALERLEAEVRRLR